MDPIQRFGADRTGRPDWPWTTPTTTIPSKDNSALPVQLPGALSTQSISVLQINTSVSQMLASIGHGVQGNQMLELMIALLILMTLLEQQSTSGSMGRTPFQGVQNLEFSSVSASLSATQISTTSLTFHQLQAIESGGAAQQQNSLDLTA